MKTKIIATVGPASENKETLLALACAGVSIIRFNFSHANYENALKIKGRINELNDEGKTNLSTLLDTKGPEIRTGDVHEKIVLQSGEAIKLFVDKAQSEASAKSLFCDYPYLVEDMCVGDIIEIDSGLLKTKVISVTDSYVEVEALNDALIGSRRHINLPGKKIRLPGITDQDKKDVLFAVENDYDFIAQSFVRTKENVLELRELLNDNGAGHIKIIAKIENQEGIENLDEIISVTDGVMVARGDLGIETPIEMLPIYQRQMVGKCLNSGKFVIVATQLLETMIENPFPTRAEISDIFNSVMQKTDCLMLSWETAMGKYPVQAVKTMASVVVEAEKQIAYKHREFSDEGLSLRDIEKKMLIRSAFFMSADLCADAILIFTKTGKLARLAAGFRPCKIVYAFTGEKHTVKSMNALFGVVPHLLPSWKQNYMDNLEKAIWMLIEEGKLQKTSKVIAITDFQKNDKEIPVLEIINIGDFYTV